MVEETNENENTLEEPKDSEIDKAVGSHWDRAFPIEDAPEFIRKKDDEENIWLVETRDHGVIGIKELAWKKIRKARKRGKGREDITILSDSIITQDGKAATYGELEIEGWMGSDVMKMLAVINVIYEAETFLSE